jgi:hypothetical protein
MFIDRRTFIKGAAVFATAPGLAILSPKSKASWPDAHVPAPLPSATGETDMNPVTFKICGWDRHDDIDQSSTNPAAEGRARDEVWIRINQSWRTAWR